MTTTATPTPSAAAGIPVKGPANNGKGSYLQTTISDDDAAMRYDANIVDPTIAAQYSPDEIADAHRFIVRFIAEEGIDSTLNDGTDIESWWSRNKEKVAPEFQEKVKSQLLDGREFVNRRSWGQDNPWGFTYAYLADQPRVKARTITTQKIFSVNDKDRSIIVKADVDYNMQVKRPEGSASLNNVKGYMQYAVRKDAATGKWLLDGQLSSYEAFEVK